MRIKNKVLVLLGILLLSLTFTFSTTTYANEESNETKKVVSNDSSPRKTYYDTSKFNIAAGLFTVSGIISIINISRLRRWNNDNPDAPNAEKLRVRARIVTQFIIMIISFLSSLALLYITFKLK